MTTSTSEDFFEAVIYSINTGENWWEQFETTEDALEALREAKKADVDEHTVALLAEAADINYIDERSIEQTYRLCLKKLKAQIK